MKCLSTLVVTLLVSLSATARQPAVHFAKRLIQVGDVQLEVEVAQTPEQHERGLMYRKKLGENQGMIFIFTDEETRFFWMKNTFVPLSIGYFDGAGNLIDIQDMAPVKSEMEEKPPSYPSRGHAQYALEMPQGWFTKKKIGLGAKLILK